MFFGKTHFFSRVYCTEYCIYQSFRWRSNKICFLDCLSSGYSSQIPRHATYCRGAFTIFGVSTITCSWKGVYIFNLDYFIFWFFCFAFVLTRPLLIISLVLVPLVLPTRLPSPFFFFFLVGLSQDNWENIFETHLLSYLERMEAIYNSGIFIPRSDKASILQKLDHFPLQFLNRFDIASFLFWNRF